MTPVRGRVLDGWRAETIEAKQDWFLRLSASQRLELALAWSRLLPKKRPHKKRVRYARLYMPNAITNSVRIVDNAGNQVLEFGKYGNFDSQFAAPGAREGKPAVSVPAIPLTWPTGAGVSEKAIYVLDTYSRRVVRVERTFAAEAVCEIK